MAEESSECLNMLKDACNCALPLTMHNADDEGNAISTWCPIEIHSEMSGWSWYPIHWDPRTYVCFGLVIGDVTELRSFSLEKISKAYPKIDLTIDNSNMSVEDLQKLHSSDESSPKPTKESTKPSLELPTSPTSEFADDSTSGEV